MSAAQRTFLALWPERATCAVLAARTQAVLPPAFRVHGANELHLTLAFLGDVDEALARALDLRLAPLVAACPRPHLTLRGTGAFPSAARARVLWVGVTEGRPGALAALQASLAQASRALGCALDARPWSAHITLARPRAGVRPARVPGDFLALDFAFSWQPRGVARVVSRPGAGAQERFRVEAEHAFAADGP